ncbi:MAG: hypothetical protein D6757_05010 [Alphaproteobacteria bacterium]|nr:MAG: hypothetical protein D6757_05010 [Alphaproteobacteria bacterium]
MLGEAQAAAIEQQAEVLIWPENWQAWQVIEACAFCWRRDANGLPLGLPLTDIEAAMRLLNVEDARDCLERVLLVQAEALRVWQGN